MSLIKKNRAVIIFMAVLLMAILGCFYVMNIQVDKPVAKIYQNNKLIREIDLSKVDKPEVLTVNNDKEYNKILIEKNNISVVEASCPDHICINQGKISTGIAPIVCLPNKLVIKIEGKENIADAVSG